MHRSASGAAAVAELAVPALSSKRPRIAEQKTILKQVAAVAVLHSIMPLVNGLKPDDMLVFSNPPVDEVFPELIKGTTEARERRDINRKEYAIAAKKNAAQYRLALGKEQFIAELIVRGVLKEHNGSKLRAMQAKNNLYHPATIGADGQSVPGTVIPDRHDGIAMLKELLE